LCAEETHLVARIDLQPIAQRDSYYTHTDFQALYVVRRGRGIHIIDGVPYGVARGDTYVMAAGATHAYSRHDDLCLDAIYFRPESFAGLLHRLEHMPGFPSGLLAHGASIGKWFHLDPSRYGVFRTQFDELRREWLTGTQEGALLTEALFARLIVTLCRASASEVRSKASACRRTWP